MGKILIGFIILVAPASLFWFKFLNQKVNYFSANNLSSPVAGNKNLTSGISGKILIGHQCPVEGISGCEDKPYKTLVLVNNLDGSRVGDFSSDNEGKFSKALAPGKYILESDNTKPPFLKPMEVTVEQNKYTQISLMFDTGIR